MNAPHNATRQLRPFVGLFALGVLLSACASKEDDSPKHGSSAGQSGTGMGLGGTLGQGGAGAGQGGTAGAAASSGASAKGGTGGVTGGQPGGGSAGRMATAGSTGMSGGAGSGNSAGRSAGGAGGSSGGTGGSAGSGASAGESTTPALHFVGRVDAADPANARFAWSGTGVVARFEGSEVSVNLGGNQQFTVVVDDMVQPKLTATTGMNALVSGLAMGEHTVELYRRTEASQGVATFMGFDFGGGTLLAPPVPTRRIEVIGDSITCGYGDEGPDMNCSFSADTENHYLSYAALTARALSAELSTVAWSGKGVVCNYGDASDSCQNPLPTYYDRTLPDDAGSKWDFSRFVPDAVVVNLGTNDFSTDSDPTQEQFESAYRALLERLRAAYPNATILCTNGPMLSGNDLSTLMGYIHNVITALGDEKVSSFDITPQDGSDGYGCDWHPSLARHEKMAATVTAAIKAKLPW